MRNGAAKIVEKTFVASAAHSRQMSAFPRTLYLFALAASILLFSQAHAKAVAPTSEQKLPDAPQPRPLTAIRTTPAEPCPSNKNAKAPVAAIGSEEKPPVTQPCHRLPERNWLDRFLSGPEVKPMPPQEKARLAAHNVLDPFNGLTILGNSAIAVGSDAHSPYGPGMTGLGRSAGVSLTQDITGEFFGTFLIPSIDHQDPHYHRMPKASITRRAANAILQVVWTRGDNDKNMVNYSSLLGSAIDDEIGNLYVPGQQTSLPASAERYGIGLATAPIDNFITEFLPDVARHIHVRVVLIQRIINKVAQTNGQSP